MHSRREFCATTTAGLGSFLLFGTASAESDTTSVSATVESAVGTSLADSHIVFVDQETIEWHRADIASDGTVQTSLPSEASYDVVFFHQPQGSPIHPEFDRVPVIYDLDSVDIDESETALGSYTLPEGHVTQLRVENEDGNPLQNVPLSLSVPSGAGTGGSTFTTNENGYLFHVESTQPGTEVAGSVTVRTHGPGGSGEILAQLFVDGDTETTAVLRNQSEYTNVIEREDTDGTATPGIVEDTSTPSGSGESADSSTAAPSGSGRSADSSTATPMESSLAGEQPGGSADRRGFFSNDADEPAALSNPLSLTVGGFVLSVAGIVYQMIGGK